MVKESFFINYEIINYIFLFFFCNFFKKLMNGLKYNVN